MNIEEKYYPLTPRLNFAPDHIGRVHLMGICGTGMASLAGILKSRGLTVTGSDQDVYPPMSEYLKELSIPVIQGYGPQNLHPPPHLVIVGNVITRDNPEAQELGRLGIPYLSFPQAIRKWAIKGSKSIVVAGTHGKTTTTSLAAWLLHCAGLNPGFMIGGIPKNFGKSFSVAEAEFFVIEGDEYDTAFFDKGPKFLHYRPWIVILTSIEFDHADIYRDLDHVKQSFNALLSLIPTNGYLIANGDDENVRELAQNCNCQKILYGFGESHAFRVMEFATSESLTSVKVLTPANHELCLETPLFGEHNISNLVSVIALSHVLNIQKKALIHSLKTYQGVKRRQEIIGLAHGVTIIDDFAHHPTSVKETIKAVKAKYPGKRIIAVFEPRSNSSRTKVFQDKYALSFDHADLVYIPEPPLMHKIPVQERFSSAKLVQDLRQRGIEAFHALNSEYILNQLVSTAKPGDVVLFMSNGAFDNLPRRLLGSLI